MRPMTLVLLAALGIGPAAYAADQPASAARPGMMGPDGMNMGPMGCMGMSDATLTATKTQLAITDAQLPLWDAFVAAVKSARQDMMAGGGMGMMHGSGAGSAQGPGQMGMMSGPLPQRLQRQEQMMTTHVTATQRMNAAAIQFYGALTPDQKAKADRLLCAR